MFLIGPAPNCFASGITGGRGDIPIKIKLFSKSIRPHPSLALLLRCTGKIAGPRSPQYCKAVFHIWNKCLNCTARNHAGCTKSAGINILTAKNNLYIRFSARDSVRNLFDIYSRSCLLYTSPSPRDATLSRMPSSA